MELLFFHFHTLPSTPSKQFVEDESAKLLGPPSSIPFCIALHFRNTSFNTLSCESYQIPHTIVTPHVHSRLWHSAKAPLRRPVPSLLCISTTHLPTCRLVLSFRMLGIPPSPVAIATSSTGIGCTHESNSYRGLDGDELPLPFDAISIWSVMKDKVNWRTVNCKMRSASLYCSYVNDSHAQCGARWYWVNVLIWRPLVSFPSQLGMRRMQMILRVCTDARLYKITHPLLLSIDITPCALVCKLVSAKSQVLITISPIWCLSGWPHHLSRLSLTLQYFTTLLVSI